MLLLAFRSSPTIDEPGHLASGIINWQFGEYAPYCVNPPLIRKLAALPALATAHETTWPDYASFGSRPEFALGEHLVRSNPQRLTTLFFVCRLPCLVVVLWGIWNCYCWACDVAGHCAGFLVLAVMGFSPLILAHGALLAPDCAAAMLFAGSLRSLYQYVLAPRFSSLLCWGVLSGLAIAAKSSILVILPLANAAVFSVLILCFRRRLQLPLYYMVSSWILGASVACFTVGWTYDFDRLFVPLQDFPFSSSTLTQTDTVLNEQGEKTLVRRNVLETSLIGRLPVPLPYYLVLGIDQQKFAMEGDLRPNSYFAGEWQSQGWLHYYVAGLILKEPLSFVLILAGIVISATLTIFTKQNLASVENGDMTFALVFMLIPAFIALALVSSQLGFNRHVRYVFPAFPLALVAVCVLACHFLPHRLLHWLVALQLVSVCWHSPHLLSYFNELAGGPLQGKRWLESSNVDWGQDLQYLREWQNQNLDKKIDFMAVQSLYSVQLYGVVDAPPPPPFVEGVPESTDRKGHRGPRPGRYAVSAIITVGREHQYGFSSAKYLETRAPQRRIGYSIEIHEIDEAEADQMRKELLEQERLSLIGNNQ